MAHIRMRHVTHINESCHTCECVMSHIRMCHVTHMNASCHTYICVMSHVYVRHVTHMNESWHTCECALALNKHAATIWGPEVLLQRVISQISCHTYKCRHVTRTNESWHTIETVHCPHTQEATIWNPMKRHVSHMNESHQTCELVISHAWMSHGTQTNQPFEQTCKLRRFEILWKRRVTHMNLSFHTYE